MQGIRMTDESMDAPNKAFAEVWRPLLDYMKKHKIGQREFAEGMAVYTGATVDQRRVSSWGSPKAYKPSFLPKVVEYLKTRDDIPKELIAPIDRFSGNPLISLASVGNVEHVNFSASPKNGQRSPETIGIPRGAEDLEFREAVRDHATGEITVLTSSRTSIERPSNLLNVSKAYAFKCLGNEMAPRHKHGETLHVAPIGLTEIATGDSIVIYTEKSPEAARIIVREYVDQDGTGIIVRTPFADKYVIAWSEFDEIHLVTGSIYKVLPA